MKDSVNDPRYKFIKEYLNGASDIEVIKEIEKTLRDESNKYIWKNGKRRSIILVNALKNMRWISENDKTKLVNLVSISGNNAELNYLEETNSLNFLIDFIKNKGERTIVDDLNNEIEYTILAKKPKDYNEVCSYIDLIRNNFNIVTNSLGKGYTYPDNHYKMLTKENINYLRKITNYYTKINKLYYGMPIYGNGFIKYYRKHDTKACEDAIKEYYYDETKNYNEYDSTRTHMMNFIKDLEAYKFIDNIESNDLKKEINIVYGKIIHGDKKIEDFTSLIEDYVQSNSYSIEDYARINNISVDDFNKALTYVKNTNDKLFNEYTNKNKDNTSVRFSIIVNKLKNSINKMNSGNKYTLLDFFRDTPNMPYKDMEKIVSTNEAFSPKEKRIFKTFITKHGYSLATLGDDDKIKNSMLTIKGHTITDEEKENILKYLDDNNIPHIEAVYKDAIREYMNGDLSISNGAKHI